MGCFISKMSDNNDTNAIDYDPESSNYNSDARLLSLDIYNCPTFPYTSDYKCRVVSVYDADTMWIVFIHNDTPIKIKLRIFGIDSSEIRGVSAEIKEFSIKVRNYVRQLFNDYTLYECKFQGYDKYGGRLIGDINIGNEWLSEHLLRKNMAIKYTGGTKLTESQWLTFVRDRCDCNKCDCDCDYVQYTDIDLQ